MLILFIMCEDFSKIDKTIDLAVALCQKEFNDTEIVEVLNGSDDVQKCIAIMNIGNIKSQKLADLLVFHLTNHGGTVREAVAIKLDSLFDNDDNIRYFQTDYIVDTICDAIIDINPNISRIILGLLNKIDNKFLILKNIEEKINYSLQNILKSDVLQNHQINKFYFKIYWLLEALNKLENIDIVQFKPLLLKIAELPEYTVREKVAQLVKKYSELSDLKEKLVEDDNYYVKRIFQ